MLKLAVSRLMLEVSEETGGDDGGCKHGAWRAVSMVESEIVKCSPKVSKGVDA